MSGADLALATDDDLLELGVGTAIHRRRLVAEVATLAAGADVTPWLTAEREDAVPVADDDDADSLCVVCLSAKRSFVLLPCGHLCVCAACTPSLKASCPMCRGPIEAVHKVYT